MNTFLDGDVIRVHSYGARFAGVVFPGETLRASIWKDSDKLLAVVTAPCRDTAALEKGISKSHLPTQQWRKRNLHLKTNGRMFPLVAPRRCRRPPLQTADGQYLAPATNSSRNGGRLGFA